jgi:cytidyltransferase-like protein
MSKRVFVSGCFDMLHSGHVAFLKQVSSYGDVYVGVGSDKTVEQLKTRKPVCSEQERLYMVKAVRYVKDACINQGEGVIDFEESLDKFRPDIFVVNQDGDMMAKREVCKRRGIEYIVIDTQMQAGDTEGKSLLPYRLDLAGTWIDQPYVSRYFPGWAITISLEPTIEFRTRSGMSTSTRNAIKKLFPIRLPDYDPELLAKLVFCFENEPSKNKFVSGAQDAIGICMPGLVRHYYNGEFWPEKIETCLKEDILTWLEKHICLVHTWDRPDGLVLDERTNINKENVRLLTEASENCWQAIMNKDLAGLAKYWLDSFNAQVRMFPDMLPDKLREFIGNYKDKALAWKLSGAGGAGYLAMVVDKPLENSIRIKIRRKENM